MADKTTQPVGDSISLSNVHLTVAATWKDPATGALYVHEALKQASAPFAEEEHIPPVRTVEQFGDVESFVSYVKSYADTDALLLTWNRNGLRAILDYVGQIERNPGRCQWTAHLPFRASTQWQAWTSFANNQSLTQKQALEKLEDLAADIVAPAPADLMGILRGLRSSMNAKAETELRPDGSSKVAFEKETKVNSSSSIDLPSSFAIAIPVLKGHVDAEGRPVVYRLDVRVRVSVDDSAHLTLRFAIPTAERVLEDVYGERVAAAKAQLGSEYTLLRAAD